MSDSNPMHQIGYGRGDSVTPKPPMSRRPTMSYSIVDEDEAKRRHGGTASAALAAIAPTELMPAVEPSKMLFKVTSVQMIVSDICEKDINAWTALPKGMRDLMLQQPQDFLLIPSNADVPRIMYAGIELRWNGDAWLVADFKAKP